MAIWPRPKKRKPHPRYLWGVRGRLKRLLKLHAEGRTSPQIGAELGVKPSTVRGKLWTLGLAVTGGGAWKFVRKPGEK